VRKVESGAEGEGVGSSDMGATMRERGGG
jgi:hypothetical protein